MVVTVESLKQEYNALLQREKKGEEFFNRATPEQVEQWKDKFVEIVVELSKLIAEYRYLTGEDMTEDEVKNGFR